VIAVVVCDKIVAGTLPIRTNCALAKLFPLIVTTVPELPLVGEKLVKETTGFEESG
jgi:hypothetical protein